MSTACMVLQAFRPMPLPCHSEERRDEEPAPLLSRKTKLGLLARLQPRSGGILFSPHRQVWVSGKKSNASPEGGIRLRLSGLAAPLNPSTAPTKIPGAAGIALPN